MAIELSAPGLQTLQPGASILWTLDPVPCTRGLVYHRPGSGVIRMASPSQIIGAGCACACRCNCRGGMLMADYLVHFGGNIQLPTGGTTGEPISLAVAIDGEIDPDSAMSVTPAAVEQPGNVGTAVIVSVPAICRCASISVRNTSAQPVDVVNPNLIISFDGVARR